MGGRGASSSISKGGNKVTLKGTEKQVEWAKEIRNTYLNRMDEAKNYYKTIIKTGSARSDEYPTTAMIYVKAYHPKARYEAVKQEMKDGGHPVYKAFKGAKSGTPERKAAGNKYRSTAAKTALERLEKEVAKKSSEEDASVWIENRMK